MSVCVRAPLFENNNKNEKYEKVSSPTLLNEDKNCLNVLERIDLNNFCESSALCPAW